MIQPVQLVSWSQLTSNPLTLNQVSEQKLRYLRFYKINIKHQRWSEKDVSSEKGTTFKKLFFFSVFWLSFRLFLIILQGFCLIGLWSPENVWSRTSYILIFYFSHLSHFYLKSQFLKISFKFLFKFSWSITKSRFGMWWG